MTISLKKRFSFDELVQENRKQILKDRAQIEAIEDSFERKHQLSDKKSAN
ncbi:FbpB family small basic protein [Virgibacillus siamensis]